jgi:hypothetical protein
MTALMVGRRELRNRPLPSDGRAIFDRAPRRLQRLADPGQIFRLRQNRQVHQAAPGEEDRFVLIERRQLVRFHHGFDDVDIALRRAYAQASA